MNKYYTEYLKNILKKSQHKRTADENDAVYKVEIRVTKSMTDANNPTHEFFSLIKKIEDDGYKDAFVKHAENHKIPEHEQWKKIPANTSYHGGRVDYMFFSETWDDNELPISGVYKVYDDSSDHCPLILDLYVG